MHQSSDRRDKYMRVNKIIFMVITIKPKYMAKKEIAR